MDSYEATRVVFSRIQNLDPENASKIMGLLLIQDHGEKEMIRLAFGPESVLHSVILNAKKELGILSNTSSAPSTASSPIPFNNPISLSRQNSGSTSSSMRILNGATNLPSPLSIPNHSFSWASSTFSECQNPEDLISPGSCYPNTTNGFTSNSSMNSAPPFYAGEDADLLDELQLQEQLAFLNDGGSLPVGPRNPDFCYQNHDMFAAGGGSGSVNVLPHRRSCSVSDINMGSDDPAGYGWKPCHYYARGYCKNGTSCRFVHSGFDAGDGGSPTKMEMMEQCHELLRTKSLQQHRLAAASQLMATSPNFPFSPNKCINYLQQQQHQHPLQVDSPNYRGAAALMIGEEMHKFGRSRLERNEFAMMNPGSRQIYLTFPSDSSFSEEDVSNYFSLYGPVQDVRIPYQQKRMFGFVTFHYPETVKLILAKGNPHFVCDARVLVKPYKEKGKVPDKFRKQQQLERGEFSGCGSPTGLDSRDPFDIQLGQRMYYNTQDLLWKRKLEEQADLQQALDMHSRRLMGLQLLDVKRHGHHQRALSTGAAISPPVRSPNFFSQNLLHSPSPNSPDITHENSLISAMRSAGTVKNLCENDNEETSNQNEEDGNGKGTSPNIGKSDLIQESLEHNLPDSLFASPKATAGEYPTVFVNDGADVAEKGGNGGGANNSYSSSGAAACPLVPPALDTSSIKSCYFQPPRFSSGHGAVGM